MAESLEQFINKQCTLNVIGIGVSDRAIALAVDFKTQNKHSHVTVAVAPTAKPVESNYITNWYKFEENFQIRGTYDKVIKKK